MRIHIDFETRSATDLVKCGATRYANDTDFRITLTALAIGDWPVLQWEGFPASLIVALAAIPDVTFHAFHAPFEIICMEVNGVEIPLSKWRCTMAHAYARSFTGSLDSVGKQLDIENKKLDSGTRLINKFSKPRKPTKANKDKWLEPEKSVTDWELFKEYNIVDVLAEREIWHKLNQWPWTEEEQLTWEMDRRINERGVPVDTLMARQAVNLNGYWSTVYDKEIKEITKGISGRQVTELLVWLQEHGYKEGDLQSETIDRVLQTPNARG